MEYCGKIFLQVRRDKDVDNIVTPSSQCMAVGMTAKRMKAMKMVNNRPTKFNVTVIYFSIWCSMSS